MLTHTKPTLRVNLQHLQMPDAHTGDDHLSTENRTVLKTAHIIIIKNNKKMSDYITNMQILFSFDLVILLVKADMKIKWFVFQSNTELSDIGIILQYLPSLLRRIYQ